MTSSNGLQLTPRHILKLSSEEKRDFLASFDYVFSDIDGVVWNVEAPIPSAPEGFEALRAAGKALTFITNNSVRKAQVCLDKFNAVNMHVDMDDVVHPSQSVVTYLKHIKFEGLIYIIGTENFKNVLRTAGFRLKDGPNGLFEESYLALFAEIFAKEPEPVRAVIIDVDYNLSSTKLIKAQLYLRDPQCLFLAGATDMLLPVRKDINIMGPGPFIKNVAEASNRQPLTLGKPGRELSEVLLRRYQIEDPKRALMIGDMLEQDVGFGKQCGFQTLAVLSGGSVLADLQAQTNPQYIPDYYADSMADFLQFLQDLS